MLYLLMAVVSSAMVSILMRISEKYVCGNMVMFCANYAACMVISLIYMGSIRSSAFETGTEIAVSLGAVTGFLYLTSFILLQKNINCNGVIFSGAAFFHERLSRHKKGACSVSSHFSPFPATLYQFGE